MPLLELKLPSPAKLAPTPVGYVPALIPERLTFDNAATPPSYTLCAVPQGNQVADGTLTLTSTGTKMRRSGTSCTSGTDLGW